MTRTMTAALLLILFSLVSNGIALPPTEVPPEPALPCFPGAIYRKAVSSIDTWTGIDAVITLPTLVTDPNRVDEKTKKPLDNASCYVGGFAPDPAGDEGTEIDAGVSWEVIREPDGSVSPQRKAFRPFWRNKKWFNAPAKPDLYFYPGDTIRLTIWTNANDKLTFRVQLLARAGQAVGDKPLSEHVAEMDAPFFGPQRRQQFKRVSAIDQTRNEGNPAQSTAAHVDGATWSHVELLRGNERRPMTPDRFTDMRCPDQKLVEVRKMDDTTGEQIDLQGH